MQQFFRNGRGRGSHFSRIIRLFYNKCKGFQKYCSLELNTRYRLKLINSISLQPYAIYHFTLCSNNIKGLRYKIAKIYTDNINNSLYVKLNIFWDSLRNVGFCSLEISMYKNFSKLYKFEKLNIICRVNREKKVDSKFKMSV